MYDWSLEEFHGWYDLVVTVEEDPTFEYRSGHIETGRESISDPAIGGLVTLKVPVYSEAMRACRRGRWSSRGGHQSPSGVAEDGSQLGLRVNF